MPYCQSSLPGVKDKNKATLLRRTLALFSPSAKHCNGDLVGFLLVQFLNLLLMLTVVAFTYAKILRDGFPVCKLKNVPVTPLFLVPQQKQRSSSVAVDSH